ncbi:Protein tyrosine phosphatase domain-containing protein [Apis cerana cerana]|uniref:Protein tyrosine phosphatase domain-containing protein n=1 Tax=Apis cerana cerana TaxID=94128 RepID=A0A2A3E4Q6_APICC|nr:Protein tyrosine phosphatase domain-containing protein [Apis cerana cerana]
MDVSSLVPAGFQGNQVDLCEIQAGYNKFSENLRKFTPQAIQCAIFCGGSRCKYENSKAWPPVHMAIQNIFSHWVTDEVLAMARPNTAQIIKKDIIAQFQGWSIKTIINLQTPGEHASCGGPLEESGFTYDPNVFMKHGSSLLLQFRVERLWGRDHEQASGYGQGRGLRSARGKSGNSLSRWVGQNRGTDRVLPYLQSSCTSERRDTVRSHETAICDTDAWTDTMYPRFRALCASTDDSFPFEQHDRGSQALQPAIVSQKAAQRSARIRATYIQTYSKGFFLFFLQDVNIVFVICERILQLCDCQEDNSPCEIKYTISSKPFTQKFISHILDKLRDSKGNIRHSYSWAESLADSCDYSSSMKACASGSQASSRGTSDDIGRLSDVFCTSPDTPSCDSVFPVLDDSCMDDVLGDGIHGQDLLDNDCYKEIQSHMSLKAAAQNTTLETVTTDEAIRVLIRDNAILPEKTKKRIQDYEMDLNHRSTAWQRLQMETDLDILSGLLFEWLETLKHPLLDVDSLSYIVVWSSKPERCLEKLPSCNRYLLEYILRFIIRLRPMTAENQSSITKRFIASLTQQTIWIKNAFYPSNRNFQKLRRGTAAKLNEFFIRLMNLIEEVNTQEMEKPSWSSKWDLVSTQLKEMETEVEHEISN